MLLKQYLTYLCVHHPWGSRSTVGYLQVLRPKVKYSSLQPLQLGRYDLREDNPMVFELYRPVPCGPSYLTLISGAVSTTTGLAFDLHLHLPPYYSLKYITMRARKQSRSRNGKDNIPSIVQNNSCEESGCFQQPDNMLMLENSVSETHK